LKGEGGLRILVMNGFMKLDARIMGGVFRSSSWEGGYHTFSTTRCTIILDMSERSAIEVTVYKGS
jgi:hypothetical protein